MSKDTRTRLRGSCEATVSGGEIPRPVPHETFYQGAASHMAPFLGEELRRGKKGIRWRNLRRRAGLNIFQVGQAEASQHTVASAQAECLCKRQMFQEQISSWINFLPKGTTSPTTQADLDTITRPALSLLPTEFLK